MDYSELIKIEGEKLRQKHTSNQKIFLYVGGIFKEKRLDILIKSFAYLEKKYPNAVLWIVGDGPDKTKIYDLSKKLEVSNIVFWGRNFQEVDKFFSAADFFVLPGVGGLALNQAMLWQCLCIVSEADGTEDDLVIDGITGLRFEKGSSKSLTVAMENFLLLDKDKLDLMKKKCENKILNDANVNTMIKIFETTFNEISD
jgi:glycosyltransferase involved in cell wall biosynthesis